MMSMMMMGRDSNAGMRGLRDDEQLWPVGQQLKVVESSGSGMCKQTGPTCYHGCPRRK